MYENIKMIIKNKKSDMDEQTLIYFTNYFYAIMVKKVLPDGISLESLIDNALVFAQKVVFYDEKHDIYKNLGPDVKGLRDPESKTIFIRNDLDEPLKEMVVYHELHHAVQTNIKNNEVGINQVSNIGRMVMEAQTQWFAEEVYKIIHNVKFEERHIPSEKLRMQSGGTIVSSLHNYEMYDNLLTKLAIILDVSKEFFVSINFLFNDNKGLKMLEEKYNEKQKEKNLQYSFYFLLYLLDYIYVVDYTAYKNGDDKDTVLRGDETKDVYAIYPQKGEKLSLEKQKKYIDSFDTSLLLSLIDGGFEYESFAKYVIDDGKREIFETYASENKSTKQI